MHNSGEEKDLRSPSPVEAVLDEVLGYLNLASGSPDSRFRTNLNRLQDELDDCEACAWKPLRNALEARLEVLERDVSAFHDSRQARHAIGCVFDKLFPAYVAHHRDLLFHVDVAEFQNPFFLAVLFETVLAECPVERGDDLSGALTRLNDFLGYRPVAVLENDRACEPYDHERFRPLPLYFRGVGVARGRYAALIEKAIEFLKETPEDVLRESHFDLGRLDELTLDLRAHDHGNPINKRTNYIFGEWDPHRIDSKGFYNRFVLRRIILDFLLEWIDEQDGVPYEESLFDAAAVLSGTMLMASAISGSGPGTFTSDVSLTSLLPLVAQQRDTFYQRLLNEATGDRACRLKNAAELTQQAFGHVRQSLNLRLAHYGAKQVQYRELSEIYARMGFVDESRAFAAVIPAAATRIECEVECNVAAGHRSILEGELPRAVELIETAEEHLQRGIRCGAIVDPWNILGFQGLVPLFSSREDSVPDQRVDRLLDLVEQLFGVMSRALSEAAVQGAHGLGEQVSERFERLARQWDRYATTSVIDLPAVRGEASFESARLVAQALSEWRSAGESAGDIAFWRQYVDHFQTTKAYAIVIEALLERRDLVAALGLMMQWLSEAELENVELESGPYSLHPLLLRWMSLLNDQVGQSDVGESRRMVQRMFAYLEANAGQLWHVPGLQEFDVLAEQVPEAEPLFDDDEDEDDEDTLFQAAYDEVVYRDSTDDGNQSDTMDEGNLAADSEFEQFRRHVEPRLRLLSTVARLWQSAVGVISRQDAADDMLADQIDEWRQHALRLQRDLNQLIASLWQQEIAAPSGEHDSNVEYDAQLQTKFYLLRMAIATSVNCRVAELGFLSCLSDDEQNALETADVQTVALYRAIIGRDAKLTRSILLDFLQVIRSQPLLYVPLDNGGHPRQILQAQSRHADLRFLLTELPRLGLIQETWVVLKTAYQMERSSRPMGTAVTEFDRLFRIALRCTLENIVGASSSWNGGQFPDDELIEIVSSVTDHYMRLWLRHKRTMRLSAVEPLYDAELWKDVEAFIRDYGAELFNAKMLTLGNVRAILHNGIDWLIDGMIEWDDPLHPSPLVADIENARLPREQAVQLLELIYSIVDDHFERYLEYNTTTTQSDYGEKFYCLLDLLRVELAYDNDAWKYTPYVIAHDVLARMASFDAVTMWEELFEAVSRETAERHAVSLKRLEARYGLHLPATSDRINERFVKPLQVNRMLALVPQILDASDENAESLQRLGELIDEYIDSTTGSGVDVPEWLQQLEQAVANGLPETREPDSPPQLPLRSENSGFSLRELRRQLRHWNHVGPRGGASPDDAEDDFL